jgi:DNA-binding response OmpR family regulator
MADDPLLIVEDDEALRALLARHLRAHGWAVIEAGSSEEATAALAAGAHPALVLLDINLPGETGWDLLRSGVLGGADAPPVVVVTATTVGPRRLREFGVAGYLPKPFALETLLGVCERLARPGVPDGTRGATHIPGKNA